MYPACWADLLSFLPCQKRKRLNKGRQLKLLMVGGQWLWIVENRNVTLELRPKYAEKNRYFWCEDLQKNRAFYCWRIGIDKTRLVFITKILLFSSFEVILIHLVTRLKCLRYKFSFVSNYLSSLWHSLGWTLFHGTVQLWQNEFERKGEYLKIFSKCYIK